MKLDALDHPKTFDFAARLGIELPTAIGHLELLWAFTGKQSSQGNVGKWPNGAIARACYWMGDPDEFIDALIGSGFIDACKANRLIVHDWDEHAPGWVRAKLKKLELLFLKPQSLERSLETSSEASLEHSTKCSEVKCSEGSMGDKSPPKRRSRLPDAFYPDATGIAKATNAGFSVADELEKFIDHHTAAGTSMLDWQAAWRTWISKAITFRGKSNANHRNTAADTIAAFTGQRQPAVPEGGAGIVVEGSGTRV